LPTHDPEWKTISKEAQDLLHGLLNTDVRKRLSAKVVLNHEWFKIDLHESKTNKTALPRQETLAEHDFEKLVDL